MGLLPRGWTPKIVSLCKGTSSSILHRKQKKGSCKCQFWKNRIATCKSSFFFCWSHLSFQGCHLCLVIHNFFQWGFPDVGSNQLATHHSPCRIGAAGSTIAFHKNRSWVGGRNTQRFWRWTVSKIERPEKIQIIPRMAGGFRGDYTICSSWGDCKKRYKDPY